MAEGDEDARNLDYVEVLQSYHRSAAEGNESFSTEEY
jgi:hypothetical protein